MSRKVDVSKMLGTTEKTTEPQPATKETPAKQTRPKYRRAIPKEARLWPDQIRELNALAQQIQWQKEPGGERITTNTLLRLAAAWIIEHGQSQLYGNTETELAQSLKLSNYPPTE